MQKKMETGQGAVKGEMAGLRKEHEKRNKEVGGIQSRCEWGIMQENARI